MNTGPFQTPEGNEAITPFVMNELLPLVREIQELAIGSAKIDNGGLNIIYNSNLNDIVKKYQSKSEKFINVYHKWSTPDILFEKTALKDKDPGYIAKAIQDYKGWEEAIMSHFNQGFRLLEFINKNVNQNQMTINNARFLCISLLALVVAIISIFLQFK